MRVRLAFADGMETGSADDVAHAGRPDAAEIAGRADGSGHEENAESARSLYRWLMGDPELRGFAEVTAPAQTQPGHMGATLDVVDVVLSNTIALSGLLMSVATWRGVRRRPPRVRFECDGVKVSVEGSSPEEIAELLRALDGGPRTGTDTDTGAGTDTDAGPDADTDADLGSGTDTCTGTDRGPGTDGRGRRRGGHGDARGSAEGSGSTE